MSSRPLIKDALFLLHVCGIDPHKYSAWSTLRAASILASVSVLCFDIFLECVLNWKGLNSIEDLSIVIAFYQFIIKFFVIAINGNSLIKVLIKMEQFWPVNKRTKEVQNNISRTCRIVRQFSRFMLGMLIFVAAVYFMKPLFDTPRTLPLHMYHTVEIHRSPYYELAFICQLIVVTIGIIALLGLDTLFVALIFNITFELKIIKATFATIQIDYESNNENLVELYQAIDHHNLILDCIKDIKELYSILLLNVYFYDMLCISTGLISIIVSGFPPTFESFLQYGMFAIFYSLQLFFYCATGSYLTNESEELSAVVYGTDWWIKTQPKLRDAYVMIIQRANKIETLTAGGMFDLSLDSFRKVVKAALSLFTLVEAVYKNN